MSLIEDLIPLQKKLNEELAKMTREERAQWAKESLRHMPGQAYLFEGEPEGPEAAD